MSHTAPLTVQSPVAHGAVSRLPAKSIIGYGLGDFANNLAFSLSTSFLLYYYTDVAGLTAAAVATMFLVVRLWDAFADLLAGRAVDSTMTRWGKFRPFLLFGAVPVLFLSYLTFHVPHNLGSGSALLYAYLTYAILGLCYSFVNIPYGSLASAMTQSVSERAKLVAARAFGAAIGGVLLTYIISPQISKLKALKASLSPEEYISRAQGIFTTTTIAFIVLGTLCYFLTFLFCREQVVRTTPKVSVRETIDTIKNNKPLAYLCASSFFYLIGLFAVGGASAYYAQYVLGDMKYMPTMILVNSGISLLITPLIPAMINKVGKKNLYQWCGVFTIVGGLGLFLLPSKGSALLIPVLIMLAIKGVGASLINTVMFGLEADTVEYGEWKTSRRSEGATYAIFSFTRKVTQSLGGFLGAWALALGGYISASKTNPNPVQPETAIIAIKATMGLVPAVAALIAMIIFIKYPLTDSLFNQIRDENESRKAERAEVVLPDGSVTDGATAERNLE